MYATIRAQRAESSAPVSAKAIQVRQADVLEIGANCIFQAAGQFFLLVEIEAPTSTVEFEPDVIFRLSTEQALALLAAGVSQCPIVGEIPEPPAGFTQELKCVFTIGEEGFIVFDVEDSTDTAVLVRTAVCPIVSGTL